MANLENQLVQLLRDFTAKVAVVVRQHALESADAALARVHTSPSSGRPPTAAKVQQSRRSPKASMGTSKQSFDADAAKTQVVSYLLANPGLRMDELSEGLKLPTSGLKPLVKKLVVERVLRAEGNTRGRRYSAAQKATSAAQPARAKAKPGRKRRKKA